MTKAQIKQQQSNRNTLVHSLSRTLIDFQNRYYQAYVDWNIHQIEYNLSRYPKGTVELLSEQFVGAPAKDSYFERYLSSYDRRRDNITIQLWMIQHCVRDRQFVETRLSRRALLTHQFINEAAQGYQIKFDRLIDKLIDCGFTDPRFLTVEKINNYGDKLEFLISNEQIECHARAIWVEGSIKEPHYRFITTIRTKK